MSGLVEYPQPVPTVTRFGVPLSAPAIAKLTAVFTAKNCSLRAAGQGWLVSLRPGGEGVAVADLAGLEAIIQTTWGIDPYAPPEPPPHATQTTYGEWTV